ncbi:MBL fold metallo-hydrolase [Clostridium uliginosum]|uniref:L-ascorbate metabolism protein UlaG, beta-lactamase superfamily n=1 Tax=Clostridium uliginosum TaxID=119641 RepID=A0A1I1MCI7_9CLOT|nr:MBL fold metallo-hydrolase [Clostridium uliginosum]SFC80353.1 L-ascorbate metabolism protein UlaG, beta-lactamase superfamily [Clostridium uliginosum]
MKLTWYGHSCFLMTTCSGKRILIDPFNDVIGYNNKFPQPDVVTITHKHFDHSYLNDINTTKIISQTGVFNFDFVHIEGIPSFHDKYNGLKRGPNIIYIFKIDNLKICHLGDLGHVPSELILQSLKNIDILFIPIGGHFSLNGLEASKISKLISSKYIIPMHYNTFKSSLYLDDAKNFLISMKNIRKINSNIIDTNTLKFDSKNEVLFLSPP